MTLKVYNSLTRRKEEFIPKNPPHVGMYVCGPTTYNYFHLGNARPLVVFDTIRRYLEYKGYKVRYVLNFTDVDDKIINRAADEKIDPLTLAGKYIEAYYEDADALNVRRADIHPRASEHIEDMIKMIEGLVEKGLAYELDRDLYFNVRRFTRYGQLAGRSLDELLAGARVEINERKRDPLDFALWKAAKPGEPSWPSPWGNGRPGWHIECSAMAIRYLGFSFDIHGGGADLAFPHHENEIAQAEGFTGKRPFVRYWMHNGFITVNEDKMSKSLGNFFIIRDLISRFSPEAVRFFLLSTHYRHQLDFDPEKMDANQRSWERLETTQRLLKDASGWRGTQDERGEVFLTEVENYRCKFETAMDDDFNTALALAALFELSHNINSKINDPDFTAVNGQVLRQVRECYERMLDVLGLVSGVIGEELTEIIPKLTGLAGEFPEISFDGTPELILEQLIELRAEERRKKNWARADWIRDKLKEIGIVLEDTPHGARWRPADKG